MRVSVSAQVPRERNDDVTDRPPTTGDLCRCYSSFVRPGRAESERTGRRSGLFKGSVNIIKNTPSPRMEALHTHCQCSEWKDDYLHISTRENLSQKYSFLIVGIIHTESYASHAPFGVFKYYRFTSP